MGYCTLSKGDLVLIFCSAILGGFGGHVLSAWGQREGEATLARWIHSVVGDYDRTLTVDGWKRAAALETSYDPSDCRFGLKSLIGVHVTVTWIVLQHVDDFGIEVMASYTSTLGCTDQCRRSDII